MTTGHLIFYSGIALFLFTAALSTIFILKKPKYDPDSAVCADADSNTRKLYTSYPTDRLTVRQEPVLPDTALLNQPPAAPVQPAAECLAQGTEILPAVEVLPQQTDYLPATEPPPRQTEVLSSTEQSGTTPLT